MAKTKDATVNATQLTDPRVQGAFETVKSSIKLYGALTAAAIVVIAVVAMTGHSVTTFMWVRSVVLLAVAVVIHRMAVTASQGNRKAFDRVETLSAIMPIAIIGVDLIPGVCPLWFAVLQGVCALPVIRAAVVTRGSTLRAVFPKGA
ncbi:hypothetical protein [Streptomyces sp. NPDC020362]|uniref:hypothetical protein n=1 Tax=unclassified Streptomyces TaxID=2593676 RepID=UPI000A96555C